MNISFENFEKLPKEKKKEFYRKVSESLKQKGNMQYNINGTNYFSVPVSYPYTVYLYNLSNEDGKRNLTKNISLADRKLALKKGLSEQVKKKKTQMFYSKKERIQKDLRTKPGEEKKYYDKLPPELKQQIFNELQITPSQGNYNMLEDEPEIAKETMSTGKAMTAPALSIVEETVTPEEVRATSAPALPTAAVKAVRKNGNVASIKNVEPLGENEEILTELSDINDINYENNIRSKINDLDLKINDFNNLLNQNIRNNSVKSGLKKLLKEIRILEKDIKEKIETLTLNKRSVLQNLFLNIKKKMSEYTQNILVNNIGNNNMLNETRSALLNNASSTAPAAASSSAVMAASNAEGAAQQAAQQAASSNAAVRQSNKNLAQTVKYLQKLEGVLREKIEKEIANNQFNFNYKVKNNININQLSNALKEILKAKKEALKVSVEQKEAVTAAKSAENIARNTAVRIESLTSTIQNISQKVNGINALRKNLTALSGRVNNLNARTSRPQTNIPVTAQTASTYPGQGPYATGGTKKKRSKSKSKKSTKSKSKKTKTKKSSSRK